MQMDVTMKPSTAGNGGTKPSTPAAAPRGDSVAVAVKAESRLAQGAQQVSGPEQLERAVSDLASAIQSVQRNLNFSIDEDSGRTVIKVIDSQSDEVIRQIPSEEVLALSQRLKEISSAELSGLLVKSQA